MTTTQKRDLLKVFAVQAATVKATSEGSGSLAGWPSVTGLLDLYDDCIFPGAFKAALPAFLRRGFVPHDHIWQWDAIVGFPTVAEERGNKLYSEFTFHSDQASQDARIKCVERINAGLEVGQSVGFTMLLSNYVYFASGPELLVYAKKNGYDLSLFDVKGIAAHDGPCNGIIQVDDLWEYSLTPSPANQQAIAIAVKSLAKGGRNAFLSANGRGDIRVTNTKKLQSICGAKDLPMAARDAKWSAKDAIGRLKAFTDAMAEPNTAFAKGFLLLRGPNDEFESYHLPIADVENGKMVASLPAIKAAADVLMGTRAGAEIPDEDRQSAMRLLDSYYAAAAKAYDDDQIVAPWAGEATANVYRGQYLGEYVEYSMTMAAVYRCMMALYNEIGDAVGGWGDYDDMSDTDLFDALGGMHDECKSLNLSIIKAIRAGTGDEDADAAMKSVRQILTSQLGNLGDGVPYTKQAQMAVDATLSLIERTKERYAMRQKDGRELSEANRQTLKQHREDLAKCVETIDDLLSKTEPQGKAAARAARLRTLRLRTLRNRTKALLAA